MLANEGKEPSDRKKYGTAVDYWSLGCVIFELEIDETRVSAFALYSISFTDQDVAAPLRLSR